jgi:hypothetical protein
MTDASTILLTQQMCAPHIMKLQLPFKQNVKDKGGPWTYLNAVYWLIQAKVLNQREVREQEPSSCVAIPCGER